MPVNGITRQSTLKIIESTIYKPKEFELSYDKLFPIEQFNPIGQAYQYDILLKQGTATVTSQPPTSKDTTDQTMSLDSVLFKPFFISTEFNYSDEELDENNFINANAGAFTRAQVNLEFEKATYGRRLIHEWINSISLKGYAPINSKGLFNHPQITPVAVAEGATGANATAKKKWENKTGLEIQADVLLAYKTARRGGLYNPRTMAISPSTEVTLMKAWSVYDSTPVIEKLKSLIPEIITVPEFEPAYNQIAPTYDTNAGTSIFMVYEKDIQNVSIPQMRDVTVTQERNNKYGSNEFLLTYKGGALLARRPQSVYIGRDI